MTRRTPGPSPSSRLPVRWTRWAVLFRFILAILPADLLYNIVCVRPHRATSPRDVVHGPDQRHHARTPVHGLLGAAALPGEPSFFALLTSGCAWGMLSDRPAAPPLWPPPPPLAAGLPLPNPAAGRSHLPAPPEQRRGRRAQPYTSPSSTERDGRQSDTRGHRNPGDTTRPRPTTPAPRSRPRPQSGHRPCRRRPQPTGFGAIPPAVPWERSPCRRFPPSTRHRPGRRSS